MLHFSPARFRLPGIIFSLGVALGSSARADEETARKYLDQAKTDIKQDNPGGVARDIELMEEQLEGVDAAAKAKLVAEGEKLKKEAAAAVVTAKFTEANKQLDAIEKNKQFPEYLKAYAANPTGDTEKANAENIAKAFDHVEEGVLKELPADDPRTAAVTARFRKMAAPVAKVFMAGRKTQLYGQIKEAWESNRKRVEGQTPPDAAPLAYAAWLEDPAAPAMGTARRSVALADVAGELLGNKDVQAFESAFADDPQVAALFRDIHAASDAGTSRLVKDAAALLDAAEKAKPDNNASTRLGQLKDYLAEHAKGAKGADAVGARVDAVLAKWKGLDDAAMAAGNARIEKLEKTAAELWPAVAKAYDGKTVEFDAVAALKDIRPYQGKLVRFTGKPNAAGYSYRMGEYAYVVLVNGQPVALKFNKQTLALRDEYEKFAGRPLSADDFRDVVGRVVAAGKVQGMRKDPLTEEYVNTQLVDAPVLELVAFHNRYLTADEANRSNVAAAGK